MVFWTAFLFLSCNLKILAQDIPDYSYDELQSLQPKSLINIDPEKIESIRGGSSIGGFFIFNDQERMMGSSTSSVFFNDKLLVSDPGNNMILEINEDNKPEWKTGRKGSGPGEFLQIDQLVESDRYLAATDNGNLKIHIFNDELTPIAELLLHGHGDVTINDQFIMTPSRFSENYLFNVYDSNPPFTEIGLFLGSVIPGGLQPRGYNFVKSNSNSRGDVIVTAPALPYIFVFDRDLSHFHTIELSGTIIQEIVDDNPEPEHVRSQEDSLVRNIINTVQITDDREIFFGIGRTLYILRNQHGGYQLHRQLQFYLGDSNQKGDNPLGIFHINTDENSGKVCLSSIHYEFLHCFEGVF